MPNPELRLVAPVFQKPKQGQSGEAGKFRIVGARGSHHFLGTITENQAVEAEFRHRQMQPRGFEEAKVRMNMCARAERELGKIVRTDNNSKGTSDIGVFRQAASPIEW